MSQQTFGDYLRKLRLAQTRPDRVYSVRGLAAKVKVASCYVSKVERGDVGPPSEKTIRKLAEALGENPVRLLAKAGKVPTELKEIFLKRPLLMADALHRLDRLSDGQIERVLAGLPEAEPAGSGSHDSIPFEADLPLSRVAEDPGGYEQPS